MRILALIHRRLRLDSNGGCAVTSGSVAIDSEISEAAAELLVPVGGRAVLGAVSVIIAGQYKSRLAHLFITSYRYVLGPFCWNLDVKLEWISRTGHELWSRA